MRTSGRALTVTRGAAHARHRRRRLGAHFVQLWVGFTLASSGDGMAYGAVPLLAVLVDPRPLAVSAVAAADSLPWLLVALPAGHLADRFERGSVMVLANVARAAALLGTAFVVLTGHMGLALLLAVVLVNAAGRAVYYSSMQAMVPDIVPTDALERANGTLTGTEAGAEHLAGPVLGSSLFALGASVPFFADAIAMVSSCFPFLRFRSKAPRPEGSSTSVWEGVRLLFSDRRLRVLLVMIGTLAGLQGMEAGVLVLLATTEWGVRTGAYGVFLATGAVGGLLGSILADRLVTRFGGARSLVSAALVSGVGYLVMASATSWVLAGPAFAVVGFAIGIGSVVAISMRQRLTPDELMGRVGGAWRGVVWGAAPVGALVAGGVAAIGGLRLPLVLAGTLQCAVALLLARPLARAIPRAIRRGTHGPT